MWQTSLLMHCESRDSANYEGSSLMALGQVADMIKAPLMPRNMGDARKGWDRYLCGLL